MSRDGKAGQPLAIAPLRTRNPAFPRSLSVRSQLDVAEGTLYPILSTKKVIVPVIPTLSRRQLVRSKSQGENPQPASGE